jgi:hypothetical protein
LAATHPELWATNPPDFDSADTGLPNSEEPSVSADRGWLPRRFARRLSRFLERRGDRLSIFLLLSLAAHSGVMLLAMLASRSVNIRNQAAKTDYESFLETVRESGLGNVPEALISDPQDLFSRMPPLSGSLSTGDRKAIYKKLLEMTKAPQVPSGLPGIDKRDRGAGLPTFGESLSLDSGDEVLTAPSARMGESGEASILRRSQRDLLKRLDFYERFEKELAEVRGGRVIVKTGLGVLEIPEEIYFRDSPYKAMVAAGAEIFRIVRGFPEAGEGLSGANELSPKVSSRGQGPILPEGVFLIYQKGLEAGEEKAPDDKADIEGPQFTDADISRILDDLMGLPETAQYAAFDEKYLQKLDPNKPALARLAREFLFTNLNSIFVVVDDFASAFDNLEELYYKKPIYDAIAAYLRERPGTRTGAELLFSYASALEFERRTIKRLFDIYPRAEGVFSGTLAEKEIFKPRSKAFVLKHIYEDLEAKLKPIGAYRSRDIEEEYVLRQKAIYGRLSETGGEIRDRALFSLGKLEWDEGDTDAALQTWREISPAFADSLFQRLRPVIPLGNTPNNLNSIREVFNDTEASGNKDLLDRLLKFHKWRKRSAQEPIKIINQ